MLCQNCEEKEARVHFTKIINGEKTEIFLCEECAEESGQIAFQNEPFSFQNLLAGILNPQISSSLTQQENIECESCGLDYQEFSEKGLFGCSSCYDQFGSRLDSLIKRIHGSMEHQGKVPRRIGGDIRIKREIKRLREQMKKAVEEENFEKAAELRDKIHKREEKLGSE